MPVCLNMEVFFSSLLVPGGPVGNRNGVGMRYLEAEEAAGLCKNIAGRSSKEKMYFSMRERDPMIEQSLLKVLILS